MLWCPTDNVSININTLISAKSKHMTPQIFQNNWRKAKEPKIFINFLQNGFVSMYLCNFYFYGLGKRIKCMVRSQIWHFRAKKYFHFITSCLFPVHFTWVSLLGKPYKTLEILVTAQSPNSSFPFLFDFGLGLGTLTWACQYPNPNGSDYKQQAAVSWESLGSLSVVSWE